MGALPDDVSVGTLISTRADGMGEDPLVTKPTAAKFYSGIQQAVSACNRSKDIKRYVVQWNDVKE